MSLSILAKGAQAPMTAPVFGHLTHTDKMKLCVRSTNSVNFFDLSDYEHPLELAADKKLLLTESGMKSYGGAGNGGAIVKGLYSTDIDSFTVMAVVQAKPKPQPTRPMFVWVLGDFHSPSIYSGIGLLLCTVWNSSKSDWELIVRGCFGGKLKSTGANIVTFVDIVIDRKTGTSAVIPDFNPPLIFATAKIDVNTESVLTVSIPSLGLESSTKISTIDYSGVARKDVQVSNNYQNKELKILGSYSTSALDTIEDQITVKEVRLDNVALSSQQIQDQYQATKAWLKAEGLININQWL